MVDGSSLTMQPLISTISPVIPSNTKVDPYALSDACFSTLNKGAQSENPILLHS